MPALRGRPKRLCLNDVCRVQRVRACQRITTCFARRAAAEGRLTIYLCEGRLELTPILLPGPNSGVCLRAGNLFERRTGYPPTFVLFCRLGTGRPCQCDKRGGPVSRSGICINILPIVVRWLSQRPVLSFFYKHTLSQNPSTLNVGHQQHAYFFYHSPHPRCGFHPAILRLPSVHTAKRRLSERSPYWRQTYVCLPSCLSSQAYLSTYVPLDALATRLRLQRTCAHKFPRSIYLVSPRRTTRSADGPSRAVPSAALASPIPQGWAYLRNSFERPEGTLTHARQGYRQG